MSKLAQTHGRGNRWPCVKTLQSGLPGVDVAAGGSPSPSSLYRLLLGRRFLPSFWLCTTTLPLLRASGRRTGTSIGLSPRPTPCSGSVQVSRLSSAVRRQVVARRRVRCLHRTVCLPMPRSRSVVVVVPAVLAPDAPQQAAKSGRSRTKSFGALEP